MTDSTRDMLWEQLKSVADTIRDYVSQINSSNYGRQSFDVVDIETDDIIWSGFADDEDDAYQAYREASGIYLPRESVDIISFGEYEFDEPTVNEVSIYEYPLEIVDERGRNWAIVIGTGGPHIEVEADGGHIARLVGYWGGETVHGPLSGDDADTFLDYFIDRD